MKHPTHIMKRRAVIRAAIAGRILMLAQNLSWHGVDLDQKGRSHVDTVKWHLTT